MDIRPIDGHDTSPAPTEQEETLLDHSVATQWFSVSSVFQMLRSEMLVIFGNSQPHNPPRWNCRPSLWQKPTVLDGSWSLCRRDAGTTRGRGPFQGRRLAGLTVTRVGKPRCPNPEFCKRLTSYLSRMPSHFTNQKQAPHTRSSSPPESRPADTRRSSRRS